jgi:hypothetical protein
MGPSTLRAPALEGLYGKPVPLQDGSTALRMTGTYATPSCCRIRRSSLDMNRRWVAALWMMCAVVARQPISQHTAYKIGNRMPVCFRRGLNRCAKLRFHANHNVLGFLLCAHAHEIGQKRQITQRTTRAHTVIPASA